MYKRHYLTAALVVLSVAAGSPIANAAEIASNTPTVSAAQNAAYYYRPNRTAYGYRGLYDYAGPPAGYGFSPWYQGQWDPFTWSTGNGYY